jgi:ABC-type Mn2+/Zn2+ transport system ATPase subunit
MKKKYSVPIKGTRMPCGLHCIKVNGIGVSAGSEHIIENVNLHIHCGNLTAIIGRNGAGKSTLMKALLGLVPHEGKIEFRDIGNNRIQKLHIGYVPQNLDIEKDSPVTVYDMFAGFLSRRPVFLPKSKKLSDEIESELGIFDAQSLTDKRVCDLSGGELQRVLLSLACTPMPNLLLLDEPVSGVDTMGREKFNIAISKIKRSYDVAIIIISHDMDFVREYADQVVLLDKTVLRQGTPKEVFESDEFKGVFGKHQAHQLI